MQWSNFFNPVSEDLIAEITQPDSHQLAYNLMPLNEFLSDDGTKADLALIGVPEERSAVENQGCGESPEAIRREFYKLFTHYNIRLVDLASVH